MFIWFEKYKAVVILFITVLIISFLYFSNQKRESAFVNSTSITDFDQNAPDAIAMDDEANVPLHIYVDIKGAIKFPGVYEMREDDRVFELIERAGGLIESADENQINYAMKLYDEMIVYIPEIGDESTPLIPSDNGLVMEKQQEKIDLNKADATLLETLPGIGPSKATAIIEYREQNGPYKQIEDIQNVSGIGAKTYERLQELITVR